MHMLKVRPAGERCPFETAVTVANIEQGGASGGDAVVRVGAHRPFGDVGHADTR